MIDAEKFLSQQLCIAIQSLAAEQKLDLSELELKQLSEQLQLQKPPRPELGDLACPCFALAKVFRAAPAQLAERLQGILSQQQNEELSGWEFQCTGAYLNFRQPRSQVCCEVLQEIAKQGPQFGRSSKLKGEKIMIEFSSPNTNKPLHLGHLRNNILGEATSRILKCNGAEVFKVNLVNDRGVHICKSMLAYRNFARLDSNGEKETPQSSGVKGDRLVGDYYVRFNQWTKEVQAKGQDKKQDKGQSEDPEQLALALLKDWEAEKPDVRQLWQTMRQWVLDGINETYQRCQITFDQFYFESETYQLGRKLIQEGLKRGIFYRREDGAVLIDLSAYKLDQKVVQRSDGTSVYITQDIGTAVARHQDFPFTQLIYVVGSEQDYHFQVLFQILRLLGLDWAEKLFHLSYGMVNLPDGKMKSREGTVVDADDLLDSLEELALCSIQQRSRETKLKDSKATAAGLALGALHYYLLQFNPQREISFNPEESLSFTGNTGPYLQYVSARIHSICKKVGQSSSLEPQQLHACQQQDWQNLAELAPAWELIKQLKAYPAALARAAEELNPAHLIKSLADIARSFSRFYHDVPILTSPEPQLQARLALCRATLQVLQNGMDCAVIPLLEEM